MPPTPLPDPGDVPDEGGLAAARDAVVCCDLTPLAILDVSGPDAPAFLNGQLSVDVRALESGVLRYASFNSPKGRMLANFVLWRQPAELPEYRALVPGDLAEALRKRLSMYVLRSKVTLTDVSSNHVRLGIGGPRAGEAVQRAFGAVPLPMTAIAAGQVTLLGLAGSRFALVAPAANASAARSALKPFARESDFAVWQWLTIRAGVPIVTATTQDAFVAQTANWDLLGGVDFQKGCYTGQEIIARTQYLGRLKERTFMFHARVTDIAAGTRLYSPVFADQPCGTVINAAPAPGGGSDLLAVLQLAAAERDDTRLGEPSGPVLERLPLPYPIPEPAAPRPRKV